MGVGKSVPEMCKNVVTWSLKQFLDVFGMFQLFGM